MDALFNFLLMAGAIQGFVFNMATLLSREKIEPPIVYLNLFVFFISMNNLQSWLIENGYTSSLFFLKHFMIPWYVLIAPMFYAFVRSYLGVAEKSWSFLRMSVFVFCLEFLARSITLILIDQKLLSFDSIRLYNLIEDVLTLTYSLFIFYKAASLIFNYEKLYAQVLSFDDLNWLKRFIKLGGGVMLLWIFSVLFNNFSESIRPPYNYYPLRLGSSILIYWIGYQGFFRYVILKDRIEIRRELRRENTEPKTKLQITSKIDKEEEVFKEIQAHIVNGQKFLDPYFSLEKLTKEMDMGTTKLSHLINVHNQTNFSDFLNRLRVEKAKTVLKDTNYSSYTIVAIGLECGFNSKSTFYTAFKKFTGQTPIQFRRQ